MARGRPVEPETRARILEDIKAGELSRNAIARKHFVSGSVVTALAADNDLEFDRTKTQAAVAARTVDLEAMRQALVQQSYQTALEILDDIRSPTVYNHFEPGGTRSFYDNDGKLIRTEPVAGEWREVLTDEPTISDKRNLATIYGIMVSKASELGKVAKASGSSAGESFIETLHDAFAKAAAALEGDPASDPTATPEDVDRDALLRQWEADHPGLSSS